MSKLERAMIAIGIMFAVTGLLVVGADDFANEQRQAEQYCEMMQLYRDTGGESGWPAYNGECK